MRSNYLVHWTGQTIETCIERLTPQNREAYVRRLVSILSNGIWLAIPSEHEILIGHAAPIQYSLSVACFTEIRLSHAWDHAHQYGLLGIGVTRKFVLDRRGGPVLYVRNRPCELVVGNVYELDRAIVNKTNQSKLRVLLGFMKGMSTPGSDFEDFRFLDEQEWRVVYPGEDKCDGLIKTTDASDHPNTRYKRPAFTMPLHPDDVRLIVFPDDGTREKALEREEVHRFLDHASKPIACLTVEECRQF